MNLPITNAILRHIFDNFGITSPKKTSIKDHDFHLHETLVLSDDDGNEEKIDAYGSEVFVEGSKFRATYFKISNNEHILVASLEDCPPYACYLLVDEDVGTPQDGIIAIQNDKGKWLECDVAMQANFLAGMERLNYIMESWQRISESKDMVDMFKSYIEYVDLKSNLKGPVS